MSRPGLTLACALCVCAFRLGAQGGSETVRGRVTDDSSRVVVGGTVHVTRDPDRLIKQTTTDSTGRFTVVFDSGTGDYLVAVTSEGLRGARRRVQRAEGTGPELTANFVLSQDLAALAAVKITALKPVRASNNVTPFTGEPGASEKWADGVNGQVNPTLAGDLNLLAANMPGITVGANGISMLGAGTRVRALAWRRAP